MSRSNEFPRPSAGCSWPALPAGFGISGFWVGRLLCESPQSVRRRQPVTRHRVAGSGESAFLKLGLWSKPRGYPLVRTRKGG